MAAKHNEAMRDLTDYAERVARAEISKIPDGKVSFEDWIDDDGVEHGNLFDFCNN